jgi:hypothetical protein
MTAKKKGLKHYMPKSLFLLWRSACESNYPHNQSIFNAKTIMDNSCYTQSYTNKYGAMHHIEPHHPAITIYENK